MNKISPEDSQLFREAVKDAVEIAPSNRVEAPRPRTRRNRSGDLRDLPASPGIMPWRQGDSADETSFCRNGVSLKKLLRNRGGAQDELDLHDSTVDHAFELLQRHLESAQNRGLRVVRIIHGKGYRSRDGVAVLKPLVRSWLISDPRVIAFHQAREREGGSGALLVFLKAS